MVGGQPIHPLREPPLAQCGETEERPARAAVAILELLVLIVPLVVALAAPAPAQVAMAATACAVDPGHRGQHFAHEQLELVAPLGRGSAEHADAGRRELVEAEVERAQRRCMPNDPHERLQVLIVQAHPGEGHNLERAAAHRHGAHELVAQAHLRRRRRRRTPQPGRRLAHWCIAQRKRSKRLIARR